MQFQKISILPTEGIGISLGMEGSVRPNNLTKCLKLNIGISSGVEGCYSNVKLQWNFGIMKGSVIGKVCLL